MVHFKKLQLGKRSTTKLLKLQVLDWNCLGEYAEGTTLELTSRERPKLEPYLRLKNSKNTSKCQSILSYSTRKNQKLDRIGASGETL